MFPLNRNRRLRSSEVIRSLVRETIISPNDFLVPLFVVEGKGIKEEIPSMPNYYRYSLDLLQQEVKDLWKFGLKSVLLFVKVPENLKDKQVFSLDLGSLIAGAKFKGEFEERLKSVIKEVTDADGDIVLFIDEIHRLNNIIEEYLYSAMEDYKIDLMIDSGPSARSVQIKLNTFTLIFEGLPKDCTSFDLVEDALEEGGFLYENIQRTYNDVYEIIL